MSFDNVRNQFWEQGFVVLEGFFTDQELSGVVQSLDRYREQVSKKFEEQYQASKDREIFDTKVVNFGGEASQDQEFQKLVQNQRLYQVTQAVLGEGYQNDSLLVMFTTRGSGQAWHRDCHYENPGHFIMNRLIYTQDLIPEAGALYVVPGSHKLTELPPGELHEPIEGEIMITPKKGTLALVHSSTFHRVQRNETDEPRVSINFRVRPKDAPAGLTSIAVFRTGKWDFAKKQMVG
jgi:ectoine hydroxylase